jgi:PKD repeat protein
MSPAAPAPQQEVNFIARCSSAAKRFAWRVNSNIVATNQDFVFRFDAEGKYKVELTAWSAGGTMGEHKQIVDVHEKSLALNIQAPDEVIAGRPIQFAGDISGPCTGVEWNFGDGTTSKETNPQHTFTNGAPESHDYQVTLRGFSASGKVAESAPHVVRVIPENKIKPPRAAFRILNRNPKAGDLLQLMDESEGLVEAWKWEVGGEATNRERNPSIGIQTAGKKAIRLEVSGPGGIAIVTNYIVVQPRFAAVAAKVSSTPQSGQAPLTLQLTGGISGDVKSVRWEFGDGQSSMDVSPSHTFTQATNYTVKITAYPSDAAQAPVESTLVISVRKPVPAWKRALPFLGCTILLAGIAALLAKHKQQKSLRLRLVKVLVVSSKA